MCTGSGENDIVAVKCGLLCCCMVVLTVCVCVCVCVNPHFQQCGVGILCGGWMAGLLFDVFLDHVVDR